LEFEQNPVKLQARLEWNPFQFRAVLKTAADLL